MKKFNLKKHTSFVKGIIIGTTICTLSISALAASGTVSFNGVNISLNSHEIASEGEYLVGGSGAEIPSTIQYTDENGGITSYIPLRSFTDNLGMELSLSSEDGMPTTSNIKNVNVHVDGYDGTMISNPNYNPNTTVGVYKFIDLKAINNGKSLIEKYAYVSAEGVAFKERVYPNLSDGKYINITVTNNSEDENLKIDAGFVHFPSENRRFEEMAIRIANEQTIEPYETEIITYEIVGNQEELDLMPIELYVGNGEGESKPVNATISVTQFN